MSNRKYAIVWFRRRLLDYFKKAGREHLPWRRKGMTAYEVWVSEIMLQQTQVSRVIGYYERFLKRFPTVEKLARATWEEFLPYYSGLGYYARGRNMLKTAQVVVNKFRGKFPVTVPELVKLPGIGPYTARAIASFAFGQPMLAWDTNVRRVLGRFFFGGKQAIGKRQEAWLERKLHSRAPELNAALMDFGSSLCLAQPKCSACMLRTQCRYFREKGQLERAGETKKTLERRKQKANETPRTLVFLHENHRRYFSSTRNTFRPFSLPPGENSRTEIKAYFKRQYNLDLSVRPPHKRVEQNGQSVLWVNAQILLGQPQFAVFPKTAVIRYTEGTLKP